MKKAIDVGIAFVIVEKHILLRPGISKADMLPIVGVYDLRTLQVRCLENLRC